MKSRKPFSRAILLVLFMLFVNEGHWNGQQIISEAWVRESTAPEPDDHRAWHPGSILMAIYQIRAKGHLDPRWSAWFAGLVVTPTENAETVLAGPLVDQAALYGVLTKVRYLASALA
jgi:hypothetical protein